MKTLTTILFVLLALTGCASNDYDAYARAQGDIARANSEAQKARYDALSQVAQTGTEGAKIAAVMALALGNSQSQSGQASVVQAPQNSQALQWASILVPSITTLASINANMRVGLANSDASARIAESTNTAFAGIAGKIQAPVVAAPVVPAANVSTVTTNTNTSNANQANTTSNANQKNTTTTATSANPTTTTLSGSGVIGTGSYVNTPTPVVTPPVVITPITTPAPVITPVVQIVPIATPTTP